MGDSVMNDVVLPQEFGLSLTGKVRALEAELLKMPQADVITEHTFTPGFYERKITIPPWTVLTGAEHKTDYHVRLEKGTIAVNTEDGVKVLTAPLEFLSKAGIQRAGRVFEDEVVWVDVYDNPDDCTDLAVLEDRLYVVPSYGLADSRTEEQKAEIAARNANSGGELLSDYSALMLGNFGVALQGELL
jgi:hypothetical protein